MWLVLWILLWEWIWILFRFSYDTFVLKSVGLYLNTTHVNNVCHAWQWPQSVYGTQDHISVWKISAFELYIIAIILQPGNTVAINTAINIIFVARHHPESEDSFCANH